jgi:NAD(P)-dependent dehydrogenase (short-subunit alcohol dehydrogenase family)
LRRRCTKAGTKVAVTDVDEGAAVSVARSLSAERSTARAYRLDVSSAQQVADVFASLASDLGVPDALVNNAGVYPSIPFSICLKPRGIRVLDINLKGPFFAAKHSLVCGLRRLAVSLSMSPQRPLSQPESAPRTIARRKPGS